MITKKYDSDFKSEGGALTLPVSSVTDGCQEGGTHSKTHRSGWTITGEIHKDYYTWVNSFEATHPTLGKVWGDFENDVFADSEEAFSDFYKNHPPDPWDYSDI